MTFIKKLLITIFFILALFGCAKNATETATDASLSQVDALEQEIKKDCPAVNYDKKMDALRNSIKTQLATCEAQKETLQERNNTLWLAIIAIIGLWLFANWAKIKTRIFK